MWRRLQLALAFLSDLRVAVRPARFQLLAVLVCAGALLVAGQGQDVVLMLVADARYVMAPLVAALFGIVTWYSARLACQVRMPDERRIIETYRRAYGPKPPPGMSADEAARRRGNWIMFVRTATPRLLGIAPTTILAVAVASQAGDAAVPAARETFLVVLCAVTLLLFLFFVFRRPLADQLRRRFTRRGMSRLAEACDIPPVEQDVHARFAELAPLTKRIAWAALALLGIAAAAAAVEPVAFGATAGVYVAFFVVLGALAVFGGWLAVATRESNMPVFTGLVVLGIAVTVASGGGRYEMRTVPGTEAAVAERPSVADAASAWLDANLDPQNDQVVPVYVVATAGGGSRAAYWTATVLDRLQQLDPAFDRRLFAISGVSGGSVGAVAHLAGDGRRVGPPAHSTPAAKAMLGRDFLAAPVLGLFLRDLPARLLPVADWRPDDRGILIERAWEAADRAAGGDGRWAAPFLSLWAERHRPWPALFLNGTEVQTGRRIIATNLALGSGPGFVGAKDLLAMTGRDVPASTAANTSARFPIVGPAASVSGAEGSPGTSQVVDGGYFENFGAVTAREVLATFWRTAARRAAADPRWDLARIQPIVIQISSDPTMGPRPDRGCDAVDMGSGTATPSTQIAAPLATMANIRGAHGLLARCALRKAVRAINAPPSEGDAPKTRGRFLHFSMCPSGPESSDPPLGWVLSAKARQQIDGYLGSDGCHGDTLANLPVPNADPRTAAAEPSRR